MEMGYDLFSIAQNVHQISREISVMKKEEILQKLAAGELAVDQASKMLAEMETPKRGQLYCKVSPKGAISVYGLQRMPVTLYVEQWERLLEFSDQVREFLKENSAQFKRKGETRPEG